MDQVNTSQRVIREPRDQVRRVFEVQTNILQPFPVDHGECFGHAVDERLDPNEAGLRPLQRLRGHGLAAAKPDLEKNVGDGGWKQRTQIGGCGPAKIKGKPRQQRFEQMRLLGTQFVALAPPEECTLLLLIAIHGPSLQRAAA